MSENTLKPSAKDILDSVDIDDLYLGDAMDFARKVLLHHGYVSKGEHGTGDPEILAIEDFIRSERLTKEDLEKNVTLSVVRFQGKLWCSYLNDFRIAGGEPYLGNVVAKEWNTTLRDVIRAFPVLYKHLGMNYLGAYPSESA